MQKGLVGGGGIADDPWQPSSFVYSALKVNLALLLHNSLATEQRKQSIAGGIHTHTPFLTSDRISGRVHPSLVRLVKKSLFVKYKKKNTRGNTWHYKKGTTRHISMVNKAFHVSPCAAYKY